MAFKRSLPNQTILLCYECLLLTLGQEEGVSLSSATESHVQTPSEGKLNLRAAQLLPDLLQSAHLLSSCRHCESGGFLGPDPQQQSKKNTSPRLKFAKLSICLMSRLLNGFSSECVAEFFDTQRVL